MNVSMHTHVCIFQIIVTLYQSRTPLRPKDYEIDTIERNSKKADRKPIFKIFDS